MGQITKLYRELIKMVEDANTALDLVGIGIYGWELDLFKHKVMLQRLERLDAEILPDLGKDKNDPVSG